MRRILVSFGLLMAVFSLAVFGNAQTLPDKQGGIQGPGVTFGGYTPEKGRTRFIGRADTKAMNAQVTTYQGNVRISLPDTSAVLIADEVVYDQQAREFIARGNVRLKLDSGR